MVAYNVALRAIAAGAGMDILPPAELGIARRLVACGIMVRKTQDTATRSVFSSVRLNNETRFTINKQLRGNELLHVCCKQLVS